MRSRPGEAHALGILNRLYAPADLADKTLEYATGLAGGATAAIGEIKLATYAGHGDEDRRRARAASAPESSGCSGPKTPRRA